VRRVAGYHPGMYFDALSFLEDERDAWRPYEGLFTLTPAQLELPVAGPDRWSGRDLLGHLVFWQERALAVARELAVGETSASRLRGEAEWDARGDAINDDALAAWRALPLDELLDRARTVAGELRGHLTVVPEARWLKNGEVQAFFASETIDHYADHAVDLAVILAAAR
jgi:hypothetical protein